jgi:hypothetical protein
MLWTTWLRNLYTFDEVNAAIVVAVQKEDHHKLLKIGVYRLCPHAPSGGIVVCMPSIVWGLQIYNAAIPVT